ALQATSSYWVRVTSSCNGAHVDSNTATVTVTQPDLVVQNVVGSPASPSTIAPGGTLGVSFTIVNQGNGGSGSPFVNDIRLSGNTSTGLCDGVLLGNLNSNAL